jgi:hypothetical protein
VDVLDVPLPAASPTAPQVPHVVVVPRVPQATVDWNAVSVTG